MAETTTLTIRVSRATRDELERIARGARRSKSFVASEVLDTFVQDQAWYAAKIEAARKSKLVPEAEMNRLFRELEGEGPLARKRKARSQRNPRHHRGG
jgi:predicted transcriptional regulator